MNHWLFQSLLVTVMWGFWGFTGKIASRSISSQNLLLFASIGSIVVYPVYMILYAKHFQFSWNNPDCYLAILGGLIGAFGSLFFYLAISSGEVSRVVAITAAYPAITVLLAWMFLHEPMSLLKGAGLLLTLVGVYLLSL
ncbi:MAG: EamA family transporter [Desulfobacterales bacterium]|nr:EamA family transporter [Desulfobacterales bacterium]